MSHTSHPRGRTDSESMDDTNVYSTQKDSRLEEHVGESRGIRRVIKQRLIVTRRRVFVRDAAGDVRQVSEHEGESADCSLSHAANRSLDLSRSLTDHCVTWGTDTTFVSAANETSVWGRDVTPTRGANDGGGRMEEKGEFKVGSDYGHGPELSAEVQLSTEPKASAMKMNESLASESSHKNNLRMRAVHEIVDSERKYCACLRTVLVHFAPSIRHSGLLSQQELGEMFPSCLEHIHAAHSLFLDRLERHLVADSQSSDTGDIFVTFLQSTEHDLFALYQAYVAQFSAALLLIRRSTLQNPQFQILMKRLHAQPSCGGLEIGAFMLTPIQRMPRYVLLLKQLLRYTDSAATDYSRIESSLSSLADFLTRLNAAIEDSLHLVSSSSPREGNPAPHCDTRVAPTCPKRFGLIQFSFRGGSLLDRGQAGMGGPVVVKRRMSGKENRCKTRIDHSPALVQLGSQRPGQTSRHPHASALPPEVSSKTFGVQSPPALSFKIPRLLQKSHVAQPQADPGNQSTAWSHPPAASPVFFRTPRILRALKKGGSDSGSSGKSSGSPIDRKMRRCAVPPFLSIESIAPGGKSDAPCVEMNQNQRIDNASGLHGDGFAFAPQSLDLDVTVAAVDLCFCSGMEEVSTLGAGFTGGMSVKTGSTGGMGSMISFTTEEPLLPAADRLFQFGVGSSSTPARVSSASPWSKWQSDSSRKRRAAPDVIHEDSDDDGGDGQQAMSLFTRPEEGAARLKLDCFGTPTVVWSGLRNSKIGEGNIAGGSERMELTPDKSIEGVTAASSTVFRRCIATTNLNIGTTGRSSSPNVSSSGKPLACSNRHSAGNVNSVVQMECTLKMTSMSCTAIADAGMVSEAGMVLEAGAVSETGSGSSRRGPGKKVRLMEESVLETSRVAACKRLGKKASFKDSFRNLFVRKKRTAVTEEAESPRGNE